MSNVQVTPFGKLVDLAQGLAVPWDPDLQISPHLSGAEGICHCGCRKGYLSPVLVDLFERIRSQVGASIRINSAFRCSSWNSKKGGESQSRHLLGCALDLDIPEVLAPSEFRRICEQEVARVRGGLGLYPTFIHVDCWPWPADRRWDRR